MAPGGSTYKEALKSNWIGLAYEVRMSPLEKSVQARAMVFMSFSNVRFAQISCILQLIRFVNFPIMSQWPHVMFKLQTTSAEHVHPTCRYELGNIRCLALEKVAESLEVSCRYQSLGCHDIFPYYSKVKHEQHCSISKTIIKSICIVVALSTTVNVKSNPQEVENATWMLTVFNFFGRQFCLHFEAFQLGTAPVYMAFLRFMGDENETKKFSYGLEVGAHSRKLTWQGIPRSIRDGHRKVRDSHDGLIIPRNMALFFSGSDKEERKLRVTGRIWREEQRGRIFVDDETTWTVQARGGIWRRGRPRPRTRTRPRASPSRRALADITDVNRVGTERRRAVVGPRPLLDTAVVRVRLASLAFNNDFCYNIAEYRKDTSNERTEIEGANHVCERREQNSYPAQAETFEQVAASAHSRKLTWQGIPRSIRDGHRKVRDSHDENSPDYTKHMNMKQTKLEKGNGVHELLECPVCTNLMYPPINQVCVRLFYSFSDTQLTFV
ncbi:hypothetical protein HID58_092461 [Brassica napus]|uniref:Seven-in-absentia protein TRAF-like domain-containing protein n=1 Tax=Brassica napus TaxID=3708 RepID=A0ABQ7WYQ1_BRANA|nr:hypothetical protein HID58_092461 [Brassica napus]